MDSDHETVDRQAGIAAPPAPKTRVMSRPAETGTPLTYLLKMADDYLAAGELHQAVEMYFSIIDDDPEAAEAAMARKHLLEIGRQYQQSGEPHQARSIYERLL
ncbi:MAG: hypothetical protein R6X20_00810 [Phycisphaerae bacterium]